MIRLLLITYLLIILINLFRLAFKRKIEKKLKNIRLKHSQTNHIYYIETGLRRIEIMFIKKSKNKIGYVHIPDMGADGFAEFHRYFLAEIAYDEAQ